MHYHSYSSYLSQKPQYPNLDHFILALLQPLTKNWISNPYDLRFYQPKNIREIQQKDFTITEKLQIVFRTQAMYFKPNYKKNIIFDIYRSLLSVRDLRFLTKQLCAPLIQQATSNGSHKEGRHCHTRAAEVDQVTHFLFQPHF